MKLLKGFQNPKAEILLKLGGSLLADFKRCKELAELLSLIAEKRRIVIFPGGGPIDNYIEEIDKDFQFPPFVHHNLCARAQDQTGLIFGSIAKNSGFFQYPVELPNLLHQRKLAIMLPMKMIVELDVFEQSWVITSDTMAAYFAKLMSIPRFAILTDVNGIYDPQSSQKDNYIKQISASNLANWGRTSVDECLPPFLLEANMKCSVINGFDLASVSTWIEDETNVGTQILPE